MKEVYADLTTDLVFKKAFASEQDKELLISLLNAFLERKQPERLKGNVFDRLFTVIKISNFSPMEQDDYIRRAMFRADQREQLKYAKDEGRKEVFSLLRQGYSLDEAERLLVKQET
ncbi:hypothetical protein R83H12_01152 [Fibrobacteria bacterium R8-3-H12]